MEKLPQSIVVLGGGPIGVELSSAMNRLGVDVTVVEMGDHILAREESELVDILSEKLRAEGLKLMTKTKAIQFSQKNQKTTLTVENEQKHTKVLETGTVLVAVGRRPNISGLQLEKAGVEFTPRGLTVNDKLQTTTSNIYACGDVVPPYQFTHVAEYEAIIATQNAFLPVKRKVNYNLVPWCTFTDPELARFGLTEEQARITHGDNIKVFKYEYSNIDRGRTDRAETGIAKFVCNKKYRLVGVSILGNRAGEVIHEALVAKASGLPFYKLSSMIHIYPTFSDIVKQPAKLCYIDKLQKNFFLKLLKTLLRK